jgi:ubiquinone/menaquinone biosynthesis C-methylase UbiE
MSQPDPLDAQRRIWSLGDYAAIARFLMPISEDVVETVGIGSFDRVLDVGVGSGNTAIAAARRGAEVVGVDLAPRQLELAAARAADERVTIELHEGNAEDLPLPDDEFDVVVSVMGMIFAPDHAKALAEMVRVCRPGGKVVLTAWSEGGWSWAWRKRAAELLPPAAPGGPQPDVWGEPDEVARRLEAAGLDGKIHHRPLNWDFASAADARDFFVQNVGPYIAFGETARALGKEEQYLAELEAIMAERNIATDGRLVLPAPYLLVVATKPPSGSR